MVFITSACSHSQMLPEASELPVAAFDSSLASVFDKKSILVHINLINSSCACWGSGLASKMTVSKVSNKASELCWGKLKTRKKHFP